MRKLYVIKLIHKVHDWDASFTFEAPNAKDARTWALLKLADPTSWIVISALPVKPPEVVKVG